MANDLRADLQSLRIDRGAAAPRRSRLPMVVLALLLLGGAAWALARTRAAVEVETTRATLAEATGPAAAGTPLLSASGYVVARRKAVVSAKIQGRLSELNVEEGSRVRAGEVIARLDDAEFEAQLQRAQASLQRAQAEAAEAQRQMELNERLAADGVLSQDELAAARSRLRVETSGVAQARADVQIAQASLANTRILAPFAGTVVKKMAEVGESVAPIPPGVNISTASGAVVALADLDTLEVEADVSESNVARLGADQPAEVGVEAFPERTYKAVLRQVIPSADRTKATVQVKVTILEKDERLRPEMSSKVTFLESGTARADAAAPARKVVSVARDAVVERAGKTVVFEVAEGVARTREVKMGATREGHVEITEGLKGGESVVLRPSADLTDGRRVKVAG
jgi:HlyD family secretion protein